MYPMPPRLSLDLLTGPPLGHRFGVFFMLYGIQPNPLDIRFQRVSGLETSVETRTIIEGGQNLYGQRVPTRIAHDNLVLERGLVLGSLLNVEFNAMMSLFKLLPSNVLVTLFNEDSIPTAAWMFLKAYPVRWATADLEADSDKFLIDTLELAYTRIQTVQL